MKKPKITIVGAGQVGATAAHLTALKELGDIILLDKAEGIAKGKALDLMHAAPVSGYHVNIIGTADYKETKDSDVVVITAGLPRKPGMSRDDLLAANIKIVKEVTQQITKYSPNAILVIVTNPLDVMVYVAQKISNFPHNHVLGMAGTLDAARFRAFLAMELNVPSRDIKSFVLGGHGDLMLPLIRHTEVKGKPIYELLPEQKIKELIERTQKGGAEIVKYLEIGSAFYAPASCVVEIVDSIVNDKKEILLASVYVDGKYNTKGVYIGVPAKIGKDGVEEVIELDLNKEEMEKFQKSVEHVKKTLEKVGGMI